MKAIVLGMNYSQFATYIRNRGLNRDNYGYYNGGNPEKLYGLSQDTKVLMLEGWSENRGYSPEDIQYIKERFKNIQYVSEGWIYGEGTFF